MSRLETGPVYGNRESNGIYLRGSEDRTNEAGSKARHRLNQGTEEYGLGFPPGQLERANPRRSWNGDGAKNMNDRSSARAWTILV